MQRGSILKLMITFTAVSVCLSMASCRACKRNQEPEVTISGRSVTLKVKQPPPEPVASYDPNIKRIEIGPRKTAEPEEPSVEDEKQEYVPQKISALPPATYEDTDLSARLREKMLDAYAGKEEAIPDVKIYISDMKYDEFVNYYKNLGYNVNTVAVPATQVIEPVLEQRPELAGKIDLSKYEEIVIHQVMIDDAGISAADKYIDPDTFEVIDKTFVTKMNK